MPVNEPLDIDGILKILPHRYPFLLVDRVTGVDLKFDGKNHVGSVVRAIKNVTFNEPFFSGHFPGLPIMPGVLIVEAMAQTAAFLGYRPRPDGKHWTFLIVGVDKARWRRQVVPGDQLMLEAKLTRDRGSILIFTCKGLVGGELAAEAEIMAKMV